MRRLCRRAALSSKKNIFSLMRIERFANRPYRLPPRSYDVVAVVGAWDATHLPPGVTTKTVGLVLTTHLHIMNVASKLSVQYQSLGCTTQPYPKTPTVPAGRQGTAGLFSCRRPVPNLQQDRYPDYVYEYWMEGE